MAKAVSTKIKRASVPVPPPTPHFEVTPERLTRAAGNSVVQKAMIEKAGQRALHIRRFTDSPVDRMYKAGRLTYAQWFAACWYQEQYALAGIAGRTTATYGDGSGGGGSSIGTKILGSERQYIARLKWREGRATIPANMVKLVDDVVLEGIVPAFRNGRTRERFALHIGKALQPMAEWLNAPGSIDEVSVST